MLICLFSCNLHAAYVQMSANEYKCMLYCTSAENCSLTKKMKPPTMFSQNSIILYS